MLEVFRRVSYETSTDSEWSRHMDRKRAKAQNRHLENQLVSKISIKKKVFGGPEQHRGTETMTGMRGTHETNHARRSNSGGVVTT